MKKFISTGLLALLLSVMIGAPAAYAATSPSLGTAASFSVLAETNITDVPPSVIGRDAGLSPAGGSFMGLSDSEVAGTIYVVDGTAPPAANATVNPGLLTTAINDMTTVWSTGGSTGIDQPCTTDWSGAGPKDLTTVSPLGPGVYCADAFLLTGNLTLTGDGVWIFKSAATLTTSAGSSVTGGDPCTIWWRLVSAASAIGTNSTFEGNILAGTSIALQTGATLNGRALAQAAVTLDHNTITGPACTPAVATTPGSSPGSVLGTSTPGLPNTGLAQPAESSPWLAVGGVVFTVSAGVYLLGKKYPA